MKLKQMIIDKCELNQSQDLLETQIQVPIFKDAARYLILGLLQKNQIFVSENYFNNFKVCRYISRFFATKIIIQRYIASSKTVEKVVFKSKSKPLTIHLFEFDSIFYSLKPKKFKTKIYNECIYPVTCKGDDQIVDKEYCCCCLKDYDINFLFCNSTCQHSYCLNCIANNIKEGS